MAAKLLHQCETVKILLSDRDVEDGDVTPTGKVKRWYLEKNYSEMIETMYRN